MECDQNFNAKQVLQDAQEEISHSVAPFAVSEPISTAIDLAAAIHEELSGNQSAASALIADTIKSTENYSKIASTHELEASVQSALTAEYIKATILDGRGLHDEASEALKSADKLRTSKQVNGLLGMGRDASFLTRISSDLAYAAHYDMVGDSEYALEKIEIAEKMIADERDKWFDGDVYIETESAAEVAVHGAKIIHFLKNGNSDEAHRELSKLKEVTEQAANNWYLTDDAKLKIQAGYELLKGSVSKFEGDCVGTSTAYLHTEQLLAQHGDKNSPAALRVAAALKIAKSTDTFTDSELALTSLLLNQHAMQFKRVPGKRPRFEREAL